MEIVNVIRNLRSRPNGQTVFLLQMSILVKKSKTHAVAMKKFNTLIKEEGFDKGMVMWVREQACSWLLNYFDHPQVSCFIPDGKAENIYHAIEK